MAINLNNNNVRNWIHVLGVLLICVFSVLGSIKVLRITPVPDDINWMEIALPFFPCLIITLLLMVVKIVTGGDASTTMALLLIFIGIAFTIIGLMATEDTTKNAMLAMGGGMLGLGLGVPLGNYLRRTERKQEENHE